MLKITLITIGKLKEQYLRDAVKEYEKRLQTLCSLKTIDVEPVKLPDNPNETQITLALDNEATKILANIPQGSFVIPLCIEGNRLSSTALANKLENLGITGHSSVCFIIGGSYGLSEKVKSKADFKLSLSEMTFPHQLARVMLLEQIYRAFKINLGGTYHK